MSGESSAPCDETIQRDRVGRLQRTPRTASQPSFRPRTARIQAFAETEDTGGCQSLTLAPLAQSFSSFAAAKEQTNHKRVAVACCLTRVDTQPRRPDCYIKGLVTSAAEPSVRQLANAAKQNGKVPAMKSFPHLSQNTEACQEIGRVPLRGG